MADEQAGKDLGGYITFESAGFERLNQLGFGDNGPKCFALGRHCLEAVCKATRPRRILMPGFTCSSVKKIAAQQGADVEYYSLSETLVPQLETIHQDDLLVLNNYFGLSAGGDGFDAWLRVAAPPRCVIDNTHSMGVSNQFPGRLSFVSPRKFLPVTDGGILFDPEGLIPGDCMPTRQDVSWHRVAWLFRALDERSRDRSYGSYIEFRKGLQDLEYLQLSETTSHLLSVIDIKAVVRRRNENYKYLRSELPVHPCFAGLGQPGDFSPIGFPLFADDASDAQARLSKHRIYTIRYWPELDSDTSMNEFERELLRHVLIIPIDQRPSESQMSVLKSAVA